MNIFVWHKSLFFLSWKVNRYKNFINFFVVRYDERDIVFYKLISLLLFLLLLSYLAYILFVTILIICHIFKCVTSTVICIIFLENNSCSRQMCKGVQQVNAEHKSGWSSTTAKKGLSGALTSEDKKFDKSAYDQPSIRISSGYSGAHRRALLFEKYNARLCGKKMP